MRLHIAETLKTGVTIQKNITIQNEIEATSLGRALSRHSSDFQIHLRLDTLCIDLRLSKFAYS